LISTHVTRTPDTPRTAKRIWMPGKLGISGNENGSHRLAEVICYRRANAAVVRNGAQLVPRTKLAGWTWGIPEWSSRAVEELMWIDVNGSPAEKGAP
jgi:hypothetical protein